MLKLFRLFEGFFLLLLTSLSAIGEVPGPCDSIPVFPVLRQVELKSDSVCKLLFSWEELAMEDSAVAGCINREIRRHAANFRPDSAGIELELVCTGELEYSCEIGLSFVTGRLASYYLTSYEYYRGTPHGNRAFDAINFDLSTGRILSIRDLVEPVRLDAFLLLVRLRLAQQLEAFGYVESEWADQLADPLFQVERDGLRLAFRSSVYQVSIVEVFFPKSDFKDFARKDSCLFP